MLALTLKGISAHKLRYLLTALAVIIGVSFMAGTMVLTETMEKTFNDTLTTANEGIDVIVRHGDAIDGDFAGAHERVGASLVEEIAGIDGVDVAAGSTTGSTQLVLADGTPSPTDGLGGVIGSNWIDDDRLNPFTIASGRAPEAAGEVVIDQRTTHDQGWSVGDKVTVLAKRGPETVTLVGTATYGDIDGIPGSSLVATDDATAQVMFGEAGKYDSVVVAAGRGVDPAALAHRITEEIVSPSSRLEALTGEADTAEKQADLKEDLSFFNRFLLAFAYVALFVGTFIIYNTFSIVVAQRTREVAMLRAIGARRGQVLRSIVFESAVVGVVAAMIGLVAGVGLSFGLRALLSTVGLDIPSGPLVVSSSTVVTAFVIGVGVSVLSALAPAVRGSRVRPVAALREVAIDRSGTSLVRTVLGILITAGGATAFGAGVIGEGDAALQLLGLGAAAVIVGVCTLGPVLVRPFVRLLGAPVAATGITGRYARENAHRNPKRTAATASALMIGVALVGFITILANSTTASTEAAVDKSFRADYVVDSGSWNQGFATRIEDDVIAVAGIEHMSPMRSAPVELAGTTTTVLGFDTAVIDDLYDLEISAGSMADVHDDGIAVSSDTAAEDGYTLGDTVTARFSDGDETTFVVRALFDADMPDAMSSWVVGLDTFERHVDDQYDRKLFLSFADDVSPERSRAALEATLDRWPNADIQDQAEFKQAVTEEISQMLNLIYGLLALAVVIALIGIANTLALSIHERTPELGLLRAIGMQRRQVKAAVRWESAMIAVMGAVLGGVLAVGGAYGIVNALDDEGVTLLKIPPVQMTVILVSAAIAGVLAAAAPARRAARLNTLEAISAH